MGEEKTKLEKYKDRYEDLSSEASKINRSLALGGIAIIWMFRFTKDEHTVLPPELFLPLIFLVLSLLLDFLHYLIGTLIWWVFFKYNEYKVKAKLIKDKEVKHSSCLPNVIWFS